MSKFKIVGLALSAICALAALASASAFGAAKGEFLNEAGLTVKGKIKVVQAAPQILETLAKVKVTCETASGEGEATTTMNVVVKGVTFKKCTKSTGGQCKTVGATEGEIRINTLNVEAVRNPALTEDLVLTELASEVEFECAMVKVKVKGGGKFLATAALQNKFETTFTLKAKCSTPGMQELTKYVILGGAEKTISEPEGLLTKIGGSASIPFEGSCQSGEATATTAEKAELV